MEMLYGLELEFYTKCGFRRWDMCNILYREGYDVEVVNYGEGNTTGKWLLKPDGSCDSELSTPILTLDEFEDFDNVVKLIHKGMLIKNTCGVHCHVSIMEGYEQWLENNNHEYCNENNRLFSTEIWEMARKVMIAWYLLEPIYKTILKTRRQSNYYCKPLFRNDPTEWWGVSDSFSPRIIEYLRENDINHLIKSTSIGDRYKMLNFRPLMCGMHTDVEFRGLEGTSSIYKIKMYVRLNLKVIEYARGLNYDEIKEIKTVEEFCNVLKLEDDLANWVKNRIKKYKR